MISSSHAIDIDTWWPTVVVSLAGTILIDGLLQLLFRTRGGRRRNVQRHFVALVEYASFLPIVTASLVGGAFWKIMFVLGLFFPISFSAWLPILIAVPPTVLAAVPAGTLINKAWAQLGTKTAHVGATAEPTLRSRLSRSLAAPLFGTVVFLAVLAGLLIQGLPLRARFALKPIRVVALRCVLTSEHPYIEAVLSNESGKPIAIDLRRYHVTVGDDKLEPSPSGFPEFLYPIYALRPLPPEAPPFFGLAQGAVATLRAELPSAARSPTAYRQRCVLLGPTDNGYFVPGKAFEATDTNLDGLGATGF